MIHVEKNRGKVKQAETFYSACFLPPLYLAYVFPT